MKNAKSRSAGSFLLTASLALFFLMTACSPKKDVAAKGTQAVQYRVKVVDANGNVTYSTTVVANE